MALSCLEYSGWSTVRDPEKCFMIQGGRIETPTVLALVVYIPTLTDRASSHNQFSWQKSHSPQRSPGSINAVPRQQIVFILNCAVNTGHPKGSLFSTFLYIRIWKSHITVQTTHLRGKGSPGWPAGRGWRGRRTTRLLQTACISGQKSQDFLISIPGSWLW